MRLIQWQCSPTLPPLVPRGERETCVEYAEHIPARPRWTGTRIHLRILHCHWLHQLFQSQFLCADLAHAELLDLAGHCRGELSDEFHVVRDFVGHDLTAAEVLKILRRERYAFLAFHPGHHLLAVVGVRDAKDVGLGDLRM